MANKNNFKWFDFELINLANTAIADAPNTTIVLVNYAVAMVIAGIFYLLGWQYLSLIVLIISSLITLISLTSAVAHKQIHRFFMVLGEKIMLLLQPLLLLPFLWIIFPMMRGFNWLMGVNTMQRGTNNSTNWFHRKDDKISQQTDVPYSKEYFTNSTGLGRVLVAEVILLLALIVVGEVSLRLMGYGQPVLYIAPYSIGYMPAPNQDTVRSGGRIFINQFGMRSDAITATKPADTYRIFMIGDSTLYAGSYIDQSEMLSERLKVILNQHLANLPNQPKRVEVLAMGVNAWGPQHKAGYLKKYGFFEADHFIVVMPIDDIRRPKYGLATLPYFHKSKDPDFAWQEIFVHLAWRFHPSGSIDFSKDLILDNITTYGNIIKHAKATGARASLFMVPNYCNAVSSGKHSEAYFKELKSSIQDAGGEFYTPVKPLHAARKTHNLYHDCTHFDVAGHQLAAKLMAKQFYGITVK